MKCKVITITKDLRAFPQFKEDTKKYHGLVPLLEQEEYGTLILDSGNNPHKLQQFFNTYPVKIIDTDPRPIQSGEFNIERMPKLLADAYLKGVFHGKALKK